MFGKNPIRKIDHGDGTTLAVQEIFYTLQGEGPFSGRPAVFIRLAGCHLACTFCDTEFETGMSNVMHIADIGTEAVRKVASSASVATQLERMLVVLTGGEPLRQNVAPLINTLLTFGVEHVQIETAGNLWVEDLGPLIQEGGVSLVCSPKTPHVHPKVKQYCRNWKYVVKSGHLDERGLPFGSTQSITLGHLASPWKITAEVRRPRDIVWLSPMDEHDPAKNAANTKEAVDACLEHGYRLSLQTHKLVGLP